MTSSATMGAPSAAVRIQAFRQPLGWEAYATIRSTAAVATFRYIGTYPSAAALEQRLERDAERYGWDIRERTYFGIEAANVLDDWRRVARVKPDGVWGVW